MMDVSAISGIRLIELSKSQAFKNHLKLQIANNPEIALARLKKFYGEVPNVSGSMNPGINYLRDLIYTLSEELSQPSLSNAFVIVAPHTHWKPSSVITYQFDSDKSRYIIGPHPVNSAGTYLPVSFSFNNGCSFAYEWVIADLVDNNSIEDLYKIVGKVALTASKDAPGFGLSIDFRFKATLTDKSINTIEIPIDDKDDLFDGFSEIITEHNHAALSDPNGLEQVAWGAKSDKLLGLDEVELELLNDLRKFLSQNKTLISKKDKLGIFKIN